MLDIDGEDFITLSFFFAGAPHSLIRPREESIHKALTRMTLTIQKKTACANKKAKAKAKLGGRLKVASEPAGASAEYRLLSYTGDGAEVLDASSLSNENWRSGMCISIMQLHVFKVVVNPPIVASVKIHPSKAIFVGCPLLPVVDILNAEGVEHTWFREEDGDWVQEIQKEGSGKAFTPSEINIGKRLKVFATPYDSSKAQYGRSAVHYMSSVVAEHPLAYPRVNEIRQDFYRLCMQPSSSSSLSRRIRIMSYNVLADPYATSKAALKYLFPYCPVDYLHIEYRSQLTLQELVASSADIMCLQEVDESVHHLFYAPHLESKGYQGCYANKRTGVTEGCAMYVKKSKFITLYSIDVALKEIIRRDSTLKSLFQNRSELLEFVGGKLGMIAHICVCAATWNPTEFYLIANTHLFYHPQADFIRLLQTHALITFVTDVKRTLEKHQGVMGLQNCVEQYENARIHRFDVDKCVTEKLTKCHVIITGDFNSTPETPAVAYLDGKTVNDDHEIWGTLEVFKSFKEDEEDKDEGDVKHDSRRGDFVETDIFSACSPPSCLQHCLPSLKNVSGFPQYTNFTKGFQDCLDYIYVSLEDLDYHTTIAPYPSYEILTENTALPSISFPSDHLPVVVDLFINSDEADS